MVPGSGRIWIAVQQSSLSKKMNGNKDMKTINKFTSSILKGMRFTKSSYLIAAVFLLAGVAGAAQAQAAEPQIPPPVCPGPDCQKVIEFWNNTGHAVFPVIQAGIQNPDPWLQALFNDNSKPFAETHYSRVYVNPVNGIPAGDRVSVTIPWYSKLENDDDKYADWYNGGRIVLFDTKEALDMATNDPDTPSQKLDFASGSPPIYTFADVGTVGKPYIIDLHVGYNVSYLDQVYLPVALAPCLNEPCDGTLDRFAVGYLGTIQALSDFRMILTNFSEKEGWPQYLPVNGIENNPRLPGAFDVLVDRVEVEENGQPSRLTPIGQSVTDLIDQWKTCTSGDSVNCPDYKLYQQVNQYFTGNHREYIEHPVNSCTGKYPIPDRLTALNIMPYVYGWVPFNRECNSATFNDLKDSPGPETWFDTTQANYVLLQYNYRTITAANKKQRFNPFTDLIHGVDNLNANSYAFSIDDLRGYQNHPGEGLIIAIGGPKGLPNTKPVLPDKANYAKDFLVTLGDSVGKPGEPTFPRPRWKSFEVCTKTAPGTPPCTEEDFKPLPPNATRDAPQFIVDTSKYDISAMNPCTITITDAIDREYKFKVNQRVPWPAHTSVPPPDPDVLTPIGTRESIVWGKQISETVEGPPMKPKFDLSPPPPDPKP